MTFLFVELQLTLFEIEGFMQSVKVSFKLSFGYLDTVTEWKQFIKLIEL